MKLLLGFCVLLAVSACSSVRREPSPPGSVAQKLEHAGERYQATEAVPGFRDSRPNESAPTTR
jgi:hypothetical protein